MDGDGVCSLLVCLVCSRKKPNPGPFEMPPFLNLKAYIYSVLSRRQVFKCLLKPHRVQVLVAAKQS